METGSVIRIAIVTGDSEKHAGMLRRSAAGYDMDVLLELRSVREAHERGEASRLDAVFVSTETADFTGFEALMAGFGARRPHLLVTSPSGRHAVEAFSVGAVDYLLTPLSTQRLEAALIRLCRIMEADQRLKRRVDMDALVSYLREHVVQSQPRQEGERVPISFGGRYRFVNTKGIRYVTADRDYVDIHMATGEVLHSTNRISELAGKLPTDRFLRIRRSIVVNIDHVREARAYKDNYEIVMDDGISFRPGSTYKVGVRAALVQKMSPSRPRQAIPDLLGMFAKS